MEAPPERRTDRGLRYFGTSGKAPQCKKTQPLQFVPELRLHNLASESPFKALELRIRHPSITNKVVADEIETFSLQDAAHLRMKLGSMAFMS